MAQNRGWFEENRSSIQSDITQEKIRDKARWLIFPYDCITMIPNTEAGLKNANQQKVRNHYYQWSSIFQGNQSIFIVPSGAITLNQVNGDGMPTGQEKFVKGSYNDVKVSKKDTQFFYGIKKTNSGGDVFSTTSFGGFGDFTTMSDQETVAFTTDIKVSKRSLTQLYFIPDSAQIRQDQKDGIYDQDYDDNDIYYISSYTNYYNDNDKGEFLYSEIEFSNIQFNMAQSGQVIEQHIYLNSPGGGGYIPKLNLDNQGVPLSGVYESGDEYKKGTPRAWDWNLKYVQNYGIKSLQIETTGNFAYAGVLLTVIPIDKNHNTLNDMRYYSPRVGMAEKFFLPITEDFYKVSNNSSSMVYADAYLQATADFPSYTAMRKDIIGDQRMTYQGIITTTADAVINDTNISQATIQDNNLVVEASYWTDSKNFTMKNGTSITQQEDYKTWNVASNQFFSDGEDTAGISVLGKNNIDLSNLYKRSNGKLTFLDLFNTMSIALLPYNRLPFETAYKYTWSLKDIPIFGNFLNKITWGMPLNWRTQRTNTSTEYPSLQTIPMMMNRDFYTMASQSIYASNSSENQKNYAVFNDLKSREDAVNTPKGQVKGGLRGKIPMDMFQRDESSTIGAVFSNKSTATSLAFKITDKISDADMYDDKSKAFKNTSGLMSTVMLNQVQQDGLKGKWGEKTHTLPANQNDGVITDVFGDSYIITSIDIKGIGDGDIRITAYSEDLDIIGSLEDTDPRDYITFQTYEKTSAAYKNGQIREWDTHINTSFLDALTDFNKDPMPWPKQMPIPKATFSVNDINNKVSFNGMALNSNTTIGHRAGKVRMQDYEYGNNGDTITLLDESKNMEWDKFLAAYETIHIKSDNIYTGTCGVSSRNGGDYLAVDWQEYVDGAWPPSAGTDQYSNDEYDNIEYTAAPKDIPLWDETIKDDDTMDDLVNSINIDTTFIGDQDNNSPWAWYTSDANDTGSADHEWDTTGQFNYIIYRVADDKGNPLPIIKMKYWITGINQNWGARFTYGGSSSTTLATNMIWTISSKSIRAWVGKTAINRNKVPYLNVSEGSGADPRDLRAIYLHKLPGDAININVLAKSYK